MGSRCTDDMLALDVRKIYRAGRLEPGSHFSWQWSWAGGKTASISIRAEFGRVFLDYRNRSANHAGGEWQPMKYAVGLDWTACAYGGERVWLRCPAAGCGRRVAVLYGGRVFACRQCHGLAYRSQREDAGDRAMRRANAGQTAGKDKGECAGLGGGGADPLIRFNTFQHFAKFSQMIS